MTLKQWLKGKHKNIPLALYEESPDLLSVVESLPDDTYVWVDNNLEKNDWWVIDVLDDGIAITWCITE